MTLLDDRDVAMALEQWRAREAADPLAFYRPHRGQRRVIEAMGVEGLNDLHVRTPNWWGKTYGVAAAFVALAQGRSNLAGLPLPRFKLPANFWALARSYPQQVDSVQAAYEKALGDWPHEKVWLDRGRGILEQLRIKPEGWHSDNTETWSKIVFRSQHNMNEKADIALGVRLSGVHGDEPPLEWVWRELRKAGRPGEPFIMVISETPLKMSEWQWIQGDFDGALGQMNAGRLEITGSLDDILIENGGFATRAERQKKLDSYRGDRFYKARATGEYMDIEGDSPFGEIGYARLGEWMKRCRDGELKQYEILTEVAGETQPLEVTVERWWRHQEREIYYVVCDLTGGLQHPAELQVYALRSPRLVARYGAMIGVEKSGVLESFGLGVLAAKVARDYGDAWIDFESNAGYGASFMRGVKSQGYRRLAAKDRREERGRAEVRYGFYTDKFSRSRWIAACQELLMENAVIVESRDVVSCLRSLRLDKNDRIVDEEHRHAEAMICMGRFGDFLQTYRPDPWRAPREPRGADAVIERHINSHPLIEGYHRNGNGVEVVHGDFGPEEG